MTNWCSNALILTPFGPSEEASSQFRELSEKIAQAVKEGNGLFYFFIPTPPELLVGDGWYNWNWDNWGVPCDACRLVVGDTGNDTLTLHFDTAWTYPTGFYRTLSRMYPKVQMTMAYSEFNTAVAGAFWLVADDLLWYTKLPDDVMVTVPVLDEDGDETDRVIHPRWQTHLDTYGLHEGG